MDHPTYEKPTRILMRPKRESDDVKDPIDFTSLSETDSNTIYDLQDECTGGWINEDKDGKSTIRSSAVSAVRKTPEQSGEVDVVAEEAITHEADHEITGLLQGHYTCQPDAIKVENREMHNQSTRLNDDAESATIDNEVTEDDTPDESIYYHEGGELFAEDVEQHIAVMPEVTTSTTEITIDDVQVGDPGIPLTGDQEDLRQLI